VHDYFGGKIRRIFFLKFKYFVLIGPKLFSEVDGQQYQGVGRNKKDAKKHCAMEALKVLYNIQYPGTLNAEVTV
jgi:hypothetical protein